MKSENTKYKVICVKLLFLQHIFSGHWGHISPYPIHHNIKIWVNYMSMIFPPQYTTISWPLSKIYHCTIAQQYQGHLWGQTCNIGMLDHNLYTEKKRIIHQCLKSYTSQYRVRHKVTVMAMHIYISYCTAWSTFS